MKGTLKRVMSGVLSVITIASAVAQPMTAYAAEPEKAASSFEAQYPELETVKDKLAEDEILTANDYSIDYGSDFDIKVDFSGIEGINDAKVKVELYEAKNEAGDDFDTYQADTYKTVYKVEPVSGNPSYRISRNVTVKEPETEQLTEPNTSENTVGEGNAGETEDSGNAEEDADAEGQPEIVTDLTEEEEVTTDEESGLTVSEVMDQAEDTVEDTSEVQKVEMKDDVTKVQISKTDISGKELPGAKLTILDKDGKTVESWTSEEKPHYVEMLPIGEYTLREETAPDGYLVAEDVKFTVKDTGEIQKVVMKDEVKPTETPTETPAETPETTSTPETKDTETTKTSTSPKTGDNTPILFWVLLAGVGMAGVGGTVILRKKKKK